MHAIASPRLLLSALLLALPLAAQDADVEQWLEELQAKADDADAALIRKVAGARTRFAAEQLVKTFDKMRSVYMRREIVRALGSFGGVAEAEQPAMEKLAEVAGATDSPELRTAAIQGLGQSPIVGRAFLKQIVESEAPDPVREMAMKAHVARATAEDGPWYRHVWNLERERRKNAEGIVLGPEAQPIRLLAFEGLAAHLGEDELIETLRTEEDPKLRREALRVMHERDLPKAADMATWVLERVDFPGADRAAAARILIARRGAEAVPVFLQLARKRDVTPEDLRLEMARLIAELDDEEVNKHVAKLVGRGKPHEKEFALHATRRLTDDKLVKAVRKQLQDREPEVRRAAAEVLAARRDRESLPDLRRLLEKPPTPADKRVAIAAIGAIEGRSATWRAELQELARDPDRDARNAALEQLVETKDPRFLPDLFAALEHEEWSTRLLAIDALASWRHKDAVPRLIDRLEHEHGRLADAVEEALWQLTGQPFEKQVESWRQWWASEASKFRVLTAAELEEAARERELRRLKQRTRSGAEFFGIRVESHRVIFVIDSSGSMIESVYGRRIGKRGAARIDVAKEELASCIAKLEPHALFNVFAFSNGVERWHEGNIAENTEGNRQAALTWVERLGARGGTNIYDSLKLAFADPDVDTICLLSDGDPTVGEEIDPHRIREDVAFWNKYRKVRIHTVLIGDDMKADVLEWLAKDSGGNHVQIR